MPAGPAVVASESAEVQRHRLDAVRAESDRRTAHLADAYEEVYQCDTVT